MTTTMKTPGVYIDEINAFPNSVVPAATALPVFIGYTEKAEYEGKSYANTPVRIESLNDYNAFFGGAPHYSVVISDDKATQPQQPFIGEGITLSGKDYTIYHNPAQPSYCLYSSMRLFYLNGGGSCYILSIGTYTGKAVEQQDFLDGLEVLKGFDGPTMILAPDSLLLPGDDYSTISSLILEQCDELKDRISVFDVYNGFITDPADLDTTVETTRQYFGTRGLGYGATYFPWLCTSVIQSSELDFTNLAFNSVDDLFALLENSIGVTNLKPVVTAAWQAYDDAVTSGDKAAIDAAKTNVFNANYTLLAASPVYTYMINNTAKMLNILPAAPAIAGVYNYTDNTQGVWKAPANVGLTAVVQPTLNITNQMQGGLNIDATTGKSINAIRTFTGMGVLIWGARTMDGNSADWRYVNVRRTMIMIEQSLKNAYKSFVFAPNDKNTWATVQSMTENFLQNLWTQGALVGSKPSEAYNVKVGLGSTMTQQDILDGYMVVNIMVSITHPAEFIIITLKQLMQKS